MLPGYVIAIIAICTVLVVVFCGKWFNAEVLYLIISQKSYINVDLILHEKYEDTKRVIRNFKSKI